MFFRFVPNFEDGLDWLTTTIIINQFNYSSLLNGRFVGLSHETT